jgi:RNA polymerase sigma factor for flagellar operon FliA
LVEANVRLVYPIAKDFLETHPWEDFDDLVGYGMVGLCHAAQDYDPNRSPSFRAYARTRIVYAIKDGIRYFNRVEKVEAVDTNNPPDPNLPRQPRSHVVSLLNDTAAATIPPGALGFLHIVDSAPAVIDIVCEISDRERCLAALKQLSPKELYVIAEYYLADRTLLDIGQALGLTESRVAQIRRQAIQKLHALVTGEEAMSAYQLRARHAPAKQKAAKAA